MSKTKQVKKHLRKRLSQRFEKRLTKELHKNIVFQIQKGIAEFIERQSNRITIWVVDVEGEKIKAVYDSNRKQVVTVLFMDSSLDFITGNVSIA